MTARLGRPARETETEVGLWVDEALRRTYGSTCFSGADRCRSRTNGVIASRLELVGGEYVCLCRVKHRKVGFAGCNVWQG
jgi:hypothetical protein